MKPILFKTEMVRAILDDRKTVTRRAVKPQPKTECSHGGQHEFIQDDFIEGTCFTGFVCRKCGYGVCGPHFKFPIGTSWIRPPYRPGDILYVRETFFERKDHFFYKADGKHESLAQLGITFKWHPSIHMPREAARIFLRVTGVRVDRLQDITEEQAREEGVEPLMMTADVDKPDSEKRWQEMLPALSMFPRIWDSTIKPSDRALYGWEANPWIWVIKFERCEKPKGE